MHEPLKNCPFCGAPAHGYAIAPHSHSPAVLRLIPELPDHPGSYVIEGQCPCGSGLIGANESEVTARWNRRTPKQEPAPPSDDAVKDAARYRFLAGHCRSTSDHWGGRWSIVVDGPAPKSHDSEDDFDAAVDAALAAQGGK